MKVRIISQTSLRNTEPGEEPVAVEFDKVKGLVVGDEQLKISYSHAEKEDIQQLELPIDELYNAVLEFS